MKVKVSKLSGMALNFAVAIAKGWKRYDSPCTQDDRSVVVTLMLDDGSGLMRLPTSFRPTTSWEISGPIISLMMKEGLLWQIANNGVDYRASLNNWNTLYYGETPLVAAMRCYVGSKLGEEVEIPSEIMEKQ